jgi:hypothetical protein
MCERMADSPCDRRRVDAVKDFEEDQASTEQPAQHEEGNRDTRPTRNDHPWPVNDKNTRGDDEVAQQIPNVSVRGVVGESHGLIPQVKQSVGLLKRDPNSFSGDGVRQREQMGEVPTGGRNEAAVRPTAQP